MAMSADWSAFMSGINLCLRGGTVGYWGLSDLSWVYTVNSKMDPAVCCHLSCSPLITSDLLFGQDPTILGLQWWERVSVELSDWTL